MAGWPQKAPAPRHLRGSGGPAIAGRRQNRRPPYPTGNITSGHDNAGPPFSHLMI